MSPLGGLEGCTFSVSNLRNAHVAYPCPLLIPMSSVKLRDCYHFCLPDYLLLSHIEFKKSHFHPVTKTLCFMSNLRKENNVSLCLF